MKELKEQAGSKQGKKQLKPNNIVIVPASLETDFFQRWCTFLRPFVKLTDRELDVAACFLKHRYELSKIISDPAVLDAHLMSNTTKEKIIEECKISPKHFYVVLSKLKKGKVIVNNTINPRLIPNIRQDDNGEFRLLLLFKDEHKSA